MNIIAIIPARMGSSRYPGKPLALIHNVPMVGHVAFRTAMSKTLAATYVATCDAIIENYCKDAGLACVMTGDHHVRCSTRTAEALLKIEAATGKKADIVVMVQGDEPMVRPEMIDAAVAPMLADPSINVVNLMAEMDTLEEFEDPNEVKVWWTATTTLFIFRASPSLRAKRARTRCPCASRSASSPSAATICSVLMNCRKARWKSTNPWTCCASLNTAKKCVWCLPIAALGAWIRRKTWPVWPG